MNSRRLLLFLFVFFLVMAETRGFTVGMDFRAYYRVSRNFLAGRGFYHAYEPEHFKYGPLAGLLMAPLSLVPFELSKRLFLALIAAATALMPFFPIWTIERARGTRFSDGQWATALGVGLLAGLRVIDNDIQCAQVNAIACCLGVVGLYFLAQRRLLGVAIFGAGAYFKIHPLIGFGVFLKDRRSVITLAMILGALACLPNPLYWLDWARQMSLTNPDIPIKNYNYVQGFYPFAANYFDIAPTSLVPLVAFACVALGFVALVPKFSLHEPTRRPEALVLGAGALLLLGLTGSRIPWHHTYVPLFAFVPVAYLLASRAEKIWLVVVSAFQGLTPGSFIGRELAIRIEVHQLGFFVTLGLAVILLVEARRYAVSESVVPVGIRVLPRLATTT